MSRCGSFDRCSRPVHDVAIRRKLDVCSSMSTINRFFSLVFLCGATEAMIHIRLYITHILPLRHKSDAYTFRVNAMERFNVNTPVHRPLKHSCTDFNHTALHNITAPTYSTPLIHPHITVKSSQNTYTLVKHSTATDYWQQNADLWCPLVSIKLL